MIKLLTVVGARPQLIKAAAISRAIATHYADKIEEIIVHTGQHYDHNMSAVFFEELKIPKEKYNLSIGSGSHAEQTARMLMGIEKLILDEKPHAVLLYGDTNSTLAASLAAVKLHVPTIHIEAGVRSYNKRFPEEVNRLICDHMSTLLFVPTRAGIESLVAEGFKENSEAKADLNTPKVFYCGDIMYDNTLYFKQVVEQAKETIVDKLGFSNKKFVLGTLHRPSNVDTEESLLRIFKAFEVVAQQRQLEILVPLHPRTQSKMQGSAFDFVKNNPHIHITEPVSFLDMIALESKAELIVTDSGGVQKEAFFMEKPCLIMLDETPWVELPETGTAILVGNHFDKIVDAANTLLSKKDTLSYPPIFGDGKAAEFICEQIIDTFA